MKNLILIFTTFSLLLTPISIQAGSRHYRSGHSSYPRHSYGYRTNSFFPALAFLVGLSACVSAVNYKKDKFYTYDGYYAKDNNHYTVSDPPLGLIITRLPSNSFKMYVNGKNYYCYRGVYYRKIYNGYQVVACPQENIRQSNTIHMQIEKNNILIPISLHRNSNGTWTDSQGTTFDYLPSRNDLQKLYN